MSETSLVPVTKKSVPRWLLMFTAITLILNGVFFITQPSFGLDAIIFFIGFVFFVKGIGECFAFFKKHKGAHVSGWVLAQGIMDTIFGFVFITYAFSGTFRTAFTLAFLVAFWFLFSGILEVVKSFEAKSYDKNWWWLLVQGIVSILFAIATFMFPVVVSFSFVIIAGILCIAFGIILIIQFFRRKPKKTTAI